MLSASRLKRWLLWSPTLQTAQASWPGGVGGLRLWYDYQQHTYQEEGGAVAGIGDPVGYWDNMRRLGASPMGSPDPPLLTDIGIRFNGDMTQFMSCLAPSDTRLPFTVFIVARPTDYGTYIFNTSGGDLINQFQLVAPNGGDRAEILRTGVSIAEGDAVTVTNFYIFTAMFSATAGCVVGVNDSEQTGANTTNINNTTFAIAIIQPVTIKEILFYNVVLSAGQRQIIRDYLNAKHGVY